MDALKELWWVILLIGGPSVIAVITQKREKRKNEEVIDLTFKNNMSTLDEYYRRKNRFDRDTRNFKKIEEARNDFA